MKKTNIEKALAALAKTKAKERVRLAKLANKCAVPPVTGEDIDNLCNKHGLTQEWIAEVLGYARQSVWAFKKGEKNDGNIAFARLIHHLKWQLKNNS